MKNFIHRFFISVSLVLPLLLHQSQAQSITALAPSSGVPGQTVDVVIRGMNTGFKSGVSKVVIIDGSDIEVKNLTVQDPQTAIATFTISSTAVPGFRTIIVNTNTESVRLENAFEVFTANTQLRVNIQALPVQSVQLSDFDLNSPNKSPLVFQCNIYNDNRSRKVKIFVFFSAASKGEIGYINTDIVTLDPLQYYKFTNNDFSHFKTSGAKGDAFIIEVRAANGLPADEYTYRMEVRENNSVITSDETVNVVTNPVNNPELITPGADFTAETEKVFSPQPLFQWFGNTQKYDFALYFVKDEQTPQEVVRSLPVFKQDDITGNNFIYPNYAEKLVEGKTYAWQVRGKFAGSKGTQYLPSQVYKFVYNGSGSGGSVFKIAITPQDIDLKTGEKHQFTAQLLDKENRPITNIQPTWQVVPSKATITQDGLLTAGNETTSIAVLVKAGSVSEFATVNIKPGETTVLGEDWMIDKMLRKIFGLPPKQ
jgi:hypothetical protein